MSADQSRKVGHGSTGHTREDLYEQVLPDDPRLDTGLFMEAIEALVRASALVDDLCAEASRRCAPEASGDCTDAVQCHRQAQVISLMIGVQTQAIREMLLAAHARVREAERRSEPPIPGSASTPAGYLSGWLVVTCDVDVVHAVAAMSKASQVGHGWLQVCSDSVDAVRLWERGRETWVLIDADMGAPAVRGLAHALRRRAGADVCLVATGSLQDELALLVRLEVFDLALSKPLDPLALTRPLIVTRTIR